MKAADAFKTIRIRRSFWIYIACIALFSSWMQAAAAVLALVIHETGHCIASAVFGSRINCIEFTPFGGVITDRAGEAQKKGLPGFVIAAAGPLANYLFLVALASSCVSRYLSLPLIKSLFAANLAMLMINILPVLPLDGGQMVFSAGYYLFPVSLLISALTLGGIGLGGIMALLSFYVFFKTQKLNLSLLMIGLYIITAAIRTKEVMISENAYVVIRERGKKRFSVERLALYRVNADTPILTLLPYMEKSGGSIFMLDNDPHFAALSDERIRSLLLSAPALTMEQAVQKENADFS